MKERYDKRQLSGNVQIDDVYYGCELQGGKQAEVQKIKRHLLPQCLLTRKVTQFI